MNSKTEKTGIVEIYSRSPLIRTPKGPQKLFVFECPYKRVNFREMYGHSAGTKTTVHGNVVSLLSGCS